MTTGCAGSVAGSKSVASGEAHPEDESRELVRAPEFGSDGTDPPIRSQSTTVSQEFFTCTVCRAPDQVDPLQLIMRVVEPVPDFEDAREWLCQNLSSQDRSVNSELPNAALALGAGVIGGVAGTVLTCSGGPIGLVVGAAAYGAQIMRREHMERKEYFGGEPTGKRILELRRLQYSKRWLRDEPVSQLAPGTRAAKAARVTLGLSSAATRELATSMGLGGISTAHLSAQLSGRLSQTVTLSEQREVTETLTLENHQAGHYRRVAVWHVEDEIRVEVLGATGDRLFWKTRAVATFTSSKVPVLTSVDIPMRKGAGPTSRVIPYDPPDGDGAPQCDASIDA